MSNSNTSSRGIGIFGILFIVFLTLKLAEVGAVATWSWWWVTAPLWAPILLGLGIWAIFGIFALLIGLIGVVGGGLSSRSRLSRMMRE